MKFSALATGVALFLTQTSGSTVERGLLESLQNEGNTKNIVVSFDGTASVLSSSTLAADLTRAERAENVMHLLQDKATSAQQSTMDLLDQFEGVQVTSFWISNTLHVKGATAQVVEALKNHDGADHVREATVIELDEPQTSLANPPTVLGNEWGIDKIKAPEVWKLGNTGEGIIVSSIDSGVRGTHEALRDNFRKKNGWYDPYDNSTAPVDLQGHGTHTMGTICGKNGIGVAPGSQWITCRGCNTRTCTEEALLKCAQFITCPHNVDGKNPDCSLAPHLVSNSWGGGRADMFYKAATDAWRKAGIIPIFANGNSGPSCDTANSPGDYNNVIAVGSTTNTDTVSSFSSRGPAAETKIVKPDISAPGSDVRSAYKTSDTSYSVLSGTSMATPHVAGVVALLLASSKTPLSYQVVYDRLTSTTDRDLTNGKTCGPANTDYPNNVFGYGRINALNVVKSKVPTPTTVAPPQPSTKPPKPTRTPKPTAPSCEYVWEGSFPECIPANLCKMDWSKLECIPK